MLPLVLRNKNHGLRRYTDPGAQPPTEDIDSAIRRYRGDRMLRGGHRRRLSPGITEWIVLFVGVEGAERRLAPEHEDPVAFDGRRNPTSIRRHGCPRRPRIRRGVVLLVHVQVCRNSADSSPDRVELALHHCRSEVLSRGRHRGSIRPFPGAGVVDLVRRENAGFTRAPYREYPSVYCVNRPPTPL